MSDRRYQAVQLEAAIDQAKSTSIAVADTVGELKNATEQVLEVGARVAAASSETVGAVIGTAAGIAAGAIAVALMPAISIAAPLLVVAGGISGLGLGVIGFRGMSAVREERALRTEQLRIKAMAERAELLRREIAAAVAAGAPSEIITGMWSTYHAQIREGARTVPLANASELPSPKPPLLLPPGDSNVAPQAK